MAVKGDTDIEVTSIEYDSRRVIPGSLFVCIPGFKTDGHLYLNHARQKGAVAFVVEREVDVEGEMTLVKVKDARWALPLLASNFYGQPSHYLKVIGVTGTNGKTTTTHLIKAILEEAGYKVGLLGTLYADWQGKREKITNTTPESVELEKFIRKVKDEGGDYVVMEVSSHALDLGRVSRIDFHSAVFTNLTQDHLDYHGSWENYRNAKARLFAQIAPKEGRFAVLNADDPASLYFSGLTRVPVITYGINSQADVRAQDAEMSLSGSIFKVVGQEKEMVASTRLTGLFSIYNCLAAIAWAWGEGISSDKISSALAKVKGVPGRFESVDEGQEFSVIVDYAHTPDGLENILKTARLIGPRRLITVFGCGGDRDRTKRPIMGEIAAKLSDFTIITSDNPRSEEPLAIIDDILVGVKKVSTAHYAVVPDRKEAIHHAIELAGKDDMVIIAGKGHEDYQIVKDKILPFDDRLVARECLREKLERS